MKCYTGLHRILDQHNYTTLTAIQIVIKHLT